MWRKLVLEKRSSKERRCKDSKLQKKEAISEEENQVKQDLKREKIKRMKPRKKKTVSDGLGNPEVDCSYSPRKLLPTTMSTVQLKETQEKETIKK